MLDDDISSFEIVWLSSEKRKLKEKILFTLDGT